MIREGHNDVVFFTGTEVERTPAYGKKTLFVVGLPSITKIQDWARTQHCEHIYFGANMSFPKLDTNDAAEWKKWEDTIQYFLAADYFCTLDIESTCVEGLTETGLCEHFKFIPMISVKLPYVQLLGYNATIKLDDKDFKATNPGVWCHMVHDLQNRNNFTDWSKYTKDTTL